MTQSNNNSTHESLGETLSNQAHESLQSPISESAVSLLSTAVHMVPRDVVKTLITISLSGRARLTAVQGPSEATCLGMVDRP